FSGIRMIKAFDLEKFMKEKFGFLNQKSLQIATKTIRVEELSTPILDFVMVAAISTVIFFGGRAVINNEMTAGQFIAYLTALGMMQQPLRKLNDCSRKLNIASS